MSNATTGWQPAPANNNTEQVGLKAKIYWAELNRVNKLSGKHQVIIGGLSERAAEELANVLKLPVQQKADKPELGLYLTCKSSNPIKAYDNSGNEIDDLIGNGSDANVIVTAYDWTSPTGTKGRSPSLRRLQVTNLIPVESAAADDSEVAFF